jgi:hypothetical protein
MQQLEIEFFWPLTEQIDLDLDFTLTENYILDKRAEQLKNSTVISGISGSYLLSNGGTSWSTNNVTPTFKFHSNPDTVGYWTVAENVQVYQEKKPRWVVRKMSELLLGWNWKDK